MSGDLQQEKKDHEKEEQQQEHELEGPALPARVLSIDEPPPPGDGVDLPGPGDDAGGNELLATVDPAGADMPAWSSGGGGGGEDAAGGGGGGAESSSVSAPSTK